MSRWPTKALADLCEITIGKTPPRNVPRYWGDGYAWLSIADMGQGRVLQHTKETITPTAVDEGVSGRLVPPGTVLLSFKLSIGKLGIAAVPLYTNEAIAALAIRDVGKLSPEYLLRALAAADLQAGTDRAVMGRTLNKAKLQRLRIPLPALPEQRRIAAILDTADAVRCKRQQTLDLADQFLRSAFLDMFGDPVTNPKGWPVRKLETCAQIQGGLQVTTKRAGNPIEVPYLRVANVYRDSLHLAEIKTIRVTPEELERASLAKGDVLVVEGHGNPDEIGRSAVWDGSIQRCTHQNHLIRVRPIPNLLESEYLSHFLNSSAGRRQMLRAGKTTSGLNTISTRNVGATAVLLPSLQQQTRFVALAHHSRALRLGLCAKAGEESALGQALLQQAFRGDL